MIHSKSGMFFGLDFLDIFMAGIIYKSTNYAAGVKGDQGDPGPQGLIGPNGKPFILLGQVATYNDLPTNLQPSDVGSYIFVLDEGYIYECN